MLATARPSCFVLSAGERGRGDGQGSRRRRVAAAQRRRRQRRHFDGQSSDDWPRPDPTQHDQPRQQHGRLSCLDVDARR